MNNRVKSEIIYSELLHTGQIIKAGIENQEISERVILILKMMKKKTIRQSTCITVQSYQKHCNR